MPTSQTQSLQSLLDQIFAARRINRQTQHDLMQLLLSQPKLSQQELAMVERVFDGLHQGRLRVVD